MSSRKEVVRYAAYTSDPSVKGKSPAGANEYDPSIDQLSLGVSDMNINPAEDDGWEEIGKKSKKKKNKINTLRQGNAQHSSTKARGHADTVQKLGMRTDGGFGRGSNQTGPSLSSDSRKFEGRAYTRQQPFNQNSNPGYVAAPAVIHPPRQNGWDRSTRATSSQSTDDGVVQHKENSQAADSQASKGDGVDDDDDDSDDLDDSDDEFQSNGYDSDESQTSHESRKKNKWLKDLFQCLEKLTVEEIKDPERQWHCPACQGVPGAIVWYRGLQPLISHAKTKRSKKMKLHRELAELLDEELRIRGILAVPAGEIFGKWKGLDERDDKEIVWPPMVMIMNTCHEKDDNGKWTGMGNDDLLLHFNEYSVAKARHSYGPKGHRGMGVLIFEATAVGYAEAERLNKHFEDDSLDRMAWNRNKVLFCPGGKRQLFGYMAEKNDIDYFNQHSKDKSKLKYELQSYQEMVVKQMKQMSEDNQKVLWLKNKVLEEQKSKKALEESHGLVTEKLRKTMVENQVVKLRTKMHHEQHKEEMDSQEQFFKAQLQLLYDFRNAKEDNFEKIQQHEREKVTQSEAYGSEAERRAKDISRYIKLQDEELKEFDSKRDKLLQVYEERRMELKRKQLALEKEFNEELCKLMEEYTPTKQVARD